MLSQLITEPASMPFARPTSTSVDTPRTVEVMGATVRRLGEFPDAKFASRNSTSSGL